ncbi:hypothetical protein [Streptomyces sp. NPDC040750]|uniref:hypothetical protein n=1 Tax=Streptomyces sp. NPDC040750 TaxID=3154491 RepID=UPI0033F4AFD0
MSRAIVEQFDRPARAAGTDKPRLADQRRVPMRKARRDREPPLPSRIVALSR